MSLAQLIPLVLQVSIGLIVFSVAVQTQAGDLAALLRRPGLLVRSLLAMNVVMPLLAAGVAVAFDLRPPVELALLLLAVSPVPPILPKKQVKAGGTESYAVSLLAVSAIVSIVAVPLSVTILGRMFGHEIGVPVPVIARVVGLSVLLPLVAGLVVRSVASSTERIAGTIGKIGSLLLLLSFIPILVTAWRGMMALVGDFSLLAIVLFTVAGLAVGHLLGGPDKDDRSVLALSTACRHPGVAIAIAGAVVEAEQKGIVTAAIFLCLVVGAIVTLPYVKWRQRAHAGPVAAAR